MKQLTAKLYVAVLAFAGVFLASCGGNGESEADKVAAAYYEEQFNDEGNSYDKTMKGAVTKWETMKDSRKMSVKGLIMKMTIGFYHEKEESPVGQYFVMENDGKEWKVRSMSRGAFFTSDMVDEAKENVGDKKAEPQFGPQEQAALDAWLEMFAGKRDIFGHEVTDPAVVAKSAESYREKYGEYIDCFVDSGSDEWTNEDGGNIRLEVYHEKGSKDFTAIIRRQDDGSWAIAH